MKVQTLIDAINFINSHEPTKTYIREHEAAPKNFEIYQISATIGNRQENIVRVLINFAKKANSKGLNEDVFIDVQGNGLSDFKILKMTPVEFRP
ncbi:MAG: hypothetical protein KJO63_11000 [Maribacter sp.]|nr:hypothetical protein [Maribacter sp.]NNK18248.1 hypothetical protein [Maribacter sp.]